MTVSFLVMAGLLLCLIAIVVSSLAFNSHLDKSCQYSKRQKIKDSALCLLAMHLVLVGILAFIGLFGFVCLSTNLIKEKSEGEGMIFVFLLFFPLLFLWAIQFIYVLPLAWVCFVKRRREEFFGISIATVITFLISGFFWLYAI